ncbi:DNA mismatch repair endonuclease MutL [Desulfonauticus submarinus]
MVPSIKILPPEIQNQIAAGEVVERPASVLKELIENSLDAGATSIEVNLKKGGLESIEVIDNGIGIQEQELELALTRHATSKITYFPDLLSISTYGFRGEALPSIASVSKFSLKSRPKQQEIGFEINVKFGQIQPKKPITMPYGTHIIVNELFANIPARLKFLKTPPTEKRRSIQTFLKQALPHTEIEFKLFSDKQEIFHFYAQEDILSRLTKIWPKHIVSCLEKINFQDDNIQITGLASRPESIQARGDRIFLYVNKRPVQDKLLLSAIKKAYEGKILRNEFPQVILFLDIPPELVDVNVHPAKLEVRFSEEKTVFNAVRKAIQNTLEVTTLFSFHPTKTNQPNSLSTIKEIKEHSPIYIAPEIKAKPTINFQTEQSKKNTFTQNKEKISVVKEDFVYLGQIDKTYLLLKQENNFLILDQHAIHERILFEEFKNQKTEKKKLLLPLNYSLTGEEKICLEKFWVTFNKMGFSLSLSANNILEINAIPSPFSPEEAKLFIQEILSKQINKFEEMLKIMACRASIKAGDELTPDEALALIFKWQSCPNKEFCPHGRPTLIVLKDDILAPLFKRGK